MTSSGPASPLLEGSTDIRDLADTGRRSGPAVSIDGPGDQAAQVGLRERLVLLEQERSAVEGMLEALPRLFAEPGPPHRVASRVAELAQKVSGATASFFLEQYEDDEPGPVDAPGFMEAPKPWQAPLLAASFDNLEPLAIDDVTRWALTEAAQRPYGTLVDGRLARSWLAVPVRTRAGGVHGVMFLCHGAARAFDRRHLRLAAALGANLAVVLDKERLLVERARVAVALQETLLPPFLPEIPGIDVAARYRPTGSGNLVGGDFYDVFPVGPGQWDVLLGDVSGVGPEAAAITGIARYTVRAVAAQRHLPSEVLAALNHAIASHPDPERFCTAVYLRLEAIPGGIGVTLARAGHPPALILRDDGSVEAVDGTEGMLLGVVPDARLEDTHFVLSDGDAVVLYTDGVLEAPGPHGDQFGDERLHHLLQTCAGRTADGIARRIELAVMDYEEGLPRDDVAVLVVRASARET